MNSTGIARTALIIALGGVFLFFGIDKFIHPILWIGWIPPWLDGFIFAKSTWLMIIGGTEAALGAALILSPRAIRRVICLLIILHLLMILSQVGINDVGVRDAGLLLSAVALWFLL